MLQINKRANQPKTNSKMASTSTNRQSIYSRKEKGANIQTTIRNKIKKRGIEKEEHKDK